DWSFAAHPQFTERSIAQRVCEGGATLLQDFLTVSDEEEPCARQSRAEAMIIDRRHHRLAGSGRGYEEIPMVAELARHLDLLQQPLLKWLQTDLRGSHDNDRSLI